EGRAVPERRRILVVQDLDASPETPPVQDGEAVRVRTLAEALKRLQAEKFAGIYVSGQDAAALQRAHSLLQADTILQVLGEGVAVVDADLRVTWANAAFEKWCSGPVTGLGFYEALGSPEILGPDYCPFHTALAGRQVQTRLHRRDHRYLDLE